MGGVLRGNGDRAAILPRRGEEATASGYGAGGPGGDLRAFVGSRGSGRPRKHGVAGSCESAELRTAARERRNAGGCRSLRLRAGTGMGGIADGCESIGPREATKARGRGRSRKRVAADGHESVGPQTAAGVRKLRAAMGCPIMSAEGAGSRVGSGYGGRDTPGIWLAC